MLRDTGCGEASAVSCQCLHNYIAKLCKSCHETSVMSGSLTQLMKMSPRSKIPDGSLCVVPTIYVHCNYFRMMKTRAVITQLASIN